MCASLKARSVVELSVNEVTGDPRQLVTLRVKLNMTLFPRLSLLSARDYHRKSGTINKIGSYLIRHIFFPNPHNRNTDLNLTSDSNDFAPPIYTNVSNHLLQ